MYAAKVVEDSVNEGDVRLTTMVVKFPRIILAEFNTHRVFSRNSASSRAIPVSKIIQRVTDTPFVPEYWGQNRPGMQASEVIPHENIGRAKEVWLRARDMAVDCAEELLKLGVHKQTVNRLLEPFMWHEVVVTSTEWDNFFALRDNEMAQPEMQRIARLMVEAYDSSKPKRLNNGEWHLPFQMEGEPNNERTAKLCAARCARVSYLQHDGAHNPEADLALADKLMSAGHMSPFEHVAVAQRYFMASNFGWGWRQLRKFVPNEDNFAEVKRG